MEEEKLTQKNAILTHLKRFGSIDPLTALRDYGCYRLAALIHILRKNGYVINTEKVTKVSRITGKKVHFANNKLQ